MSGAEGAIRRWAALWLVLASVALVASAWWLRAPTIPYLGVAILATVLVAGATTRLDARSMGSRGWAWAFTASVAAFLTLAITADRREGALGRDPAAAYRALADRGVALLQAEVTRSATAIRAVADSAVRTPSDPAIAFPVLRRLLSDHTRPERGVVVFDSTIATSWAGTMRTPVERLAPPGGLEFTPFYVVLYAVAEREGRRAVAVELLGAVPPATSLGSPLADDVARRVGLRGFEFASGARSGDGWVPLIVEGATAPSVRAVAFSLGESRQRLRDREALGDVVLLTLACFLFLITAWRRPAGLTQRLASLASILAVIAVVPLSAFSNLTRLFDAGVYFADLGGPFTANAGALVLTSAVALAGFFALQRDPRRVTRRAPAIVVVLVVATLGPFLLRDLARGIQPPPRGVTTTLWLSWQVALFLAGAALLLAGVSAGRVALGARRGVSPLTGPILAAVAAIIGPLLWEAPGSWPGWYPVPWVVAMGALALSRRSRSLIVSTAVVAACGATTLVWGATARKRVELAEADIARLSRIDATAFELLERFARDLMVRIPPVERDELLRRYVQSDLASGGYPVQLSSWLPGSSQPYASLQIATFDHDREAERALVDSARVLGRPIVREDSTTYGIELSLAVPYEDEGATTVIVAPRTLLIPNNPYTALIGLGGADDTEPPYEVTLTNLDEPSTLPVTPRWTRKGTELHGDASLPAASRPARVHLEVDLRGLDALVPRGALIIILDLLLLSVLWTLAATANGGVARWWRKRIAGFGRSYRARLTLTLFSFFVLPAIVFAWWSYVRLQTGDRQSRELLVRETLKAIEPTGDPLVLGYESGRLGTPLFLYADGALRAASDPLYAELAPVGRYLPPAVALVLAGEDEVSTSERVPLGGRLTLFGYRALLGLGEARGAVLAAPARINELVLDRQRRDLGVLVLFAVALGALAALWLSGLAARQLGRPIGALRTAALRIAGGGRHLQMPVRPPAEFVPVFSAFQRMDEDLASGREALEEAQRRTEAVLRNVASGVIAVDRQGRLTIANPRAEVLLGGPLRPGVPIDQLMTSDLASRIRDFLGHATDDESFAQELKGRQLRGNLTRLTRGAGGVVLTLDDITEVARAQRVLAWGEMARQVAHEIKNPLTPIRLGVQHLRRARVDRRVDFERVFEQNVTRILAEIDRLDEIARAFSRYGMAPAERMPARSVDVSAIIRDVVELERLGEGTMAWGVSGLDGPLPVQASADELREVLLNVFENARQAQAGRVDITVDAANDDVHIEIHDDGVGIPPDILPRIFEPHFSTRTSGSGLGLAISRSLVRAWGGEMHVSSVTGQGTSVHLTLVATPRE